MNYQDYNLNPMGLLNIQQPNISIDPMQVQQERQKVENKEYEELMRRKKYGNLMLAFSDILKGRDPTPGVLQRQSAMEEDLRKRQQKQQQERTAKSAAAYLKSIGATEEQIQLIKDQPEAASQVILKSFEKEKPLTEKQKYDELAAQIKQEIALKGRGSPAFDAAKGGNPNLLAFYDDYIKTGTINPLTAAIAGLFPQQGSVAPQGQKSYKVIGASFKGESAEKVIKRAMDANSGMNRQEVIKNLIANGIISEG
jgi:hypothetical protein